jgi:crossover junction endodeoxyribonuclease RuvC
MSDYFEMTAEMGPCILGIDPGLSGALGFYFPAVGRVALEDAPTADGEINSPALAARIRAFTPAMIVLEQVHAMPKQGVSSTFTFGASYGQIRGVVGALGIPLYLVTPRKWKKHFQLSADKEESRGRAIQLFPANAERLTRKKDHGRAEAALLAKYGAECLFDWKAKAA